MNNGNLLNSLLAMSSSNSAATKASSAKARAESSEKFQQALEQARPEVAARQPVARQESATTEASATTRSAPKPLARNNSQSDTQSAEARSKAQQDESTAADKANEAPESPAPTADANAPVDAEQKDVKSAEDQDKTQGDQDKTKDEKDDAVAGGVLLTDPSLALAGQTGALLVSPEHLLDPDGNPQGLDDTDLDALLTTEMPLDGSLLLPDASLSPLAALAAGKAGEAGDTKTSPLTATNQAALGQVAAGLATKSQLAVGQSLDLQASLADGLSDKLTLDSATDATDAESELTSDTGSGDNPDFLLLNTKAALNKLTEANLFAPAQDQAAPATDAAKPSAVGAAVESLTRLTEAQSPAARAFVVQTGVPVTVGTPQWSQAVGDKVLWLAAQNVSAAEIRLDPPDLGPMQVKVSINQDQASITFTSPHPVVREALDQHLHRLREMFSEQGLNLVNVDVSDKSFAQQEREQKESTKNQANADLDEDDLAPVGLSQAISMRLVDHYA